MSKWLNWKPIDKKTSKHIAIFLTPIPQNNKNQKEKRSLSSSSGAFATLRKIYTIGIAPQDFLSAIKAKNNTYFGLQPDGATHTTIERLAMLGETMGEALDTLKSFEFPCEHKYERKELLLTVATMLPEGWIIKVKGMYIKGVPPKDESDDDY
tara:strand:- start:198 stop:656 length:459 start_codon:yes stop_codon:yes gene_type:complete